MKTSPAQLRATKNWRKRHPEKYHAYVKKHYQKNREKILAKQRQRYREHPEKFKAAMLKWLNRNREKYNAYHREYQRKKSEKKINARLRERRTQKKTQVVLND